MTKSQHLIESTITRSIIVGAALSCLGAVVVFASPVQMNSVTRNAAIQHTSFAPLAKGPAVSLSRTDKSDEDCVEVTKVVGTTSAPFGALYAPRNLTCGE